MQVTVTFASAREARHEEDRVEGCVLFLPEIETAVWDGRTLTYETDQTAEEVIQEWDEQGYEAGDLLQFSFSA